MAAKFKSLLRDQAFQNMLGLAALAIVIYGVGAGLAQADHPAGASASYAVALVFALIAGIGLALLVAEHFSAPLRTNFFRRFQLRSPLAIVRPVAAAAVPNEPANTIWKGLRWRLERGDARAYCNEAGHESHAILFEKDGRTETRFIAQFLGDTNYLKCSAGEGHPVLLDGRSRLTVREFNAAAIEAEMRLRAG